MGLEVEVGRKELQVAVADILGEQGRSLSARGQAAGWAPSAHLARPHLAVLEPQLDLGVVHDLAQVPHGHLAPPLLENAQQRLVQVFSLALQAREVLWGAALRGGAEPQHARTRPTASRGVCVAAWWRP